MKDSYLKSKVKLESFHNIPLLTDIIGINLKAYMSVQSLSVDQWSVYGGGGERPYRVQRSVCDKVIFFHIVETNY